MKSKAADFSRKPAANCLPHPHFGAPTRQSSGAATQRRTGASARRRSGAPAHRRGGAPAHRRSGASALRDCRWSDGGTGHNAALSSGNAERARGAEVPILKSIRAAGALLAAAVGALTARPAAEDRLEIIASLEILAASPKP
jgi:hypothetical protein